MAVGRCEQNAYVSLLTIMKSSGYCQCVWTVLHQKRLLRGKTLDSLTRHQIHLACAALVCMCRVVSCTIW